MNSSLIQLLSQFDGIISEKQIGQALNIGQGHDFDLIRDSLEADERFVGCEEACWRRAPIETLIEDKPIREVSFVITDIETTGSIKGKDRIIEIAAAKFKNSNIIDRFESLINPEKNISNQIARLTKITNQIVENAPTIETVLPEFKAFADGSIFVAHNALFDFQFILAELYRLGLGALSPPVEICTYRLARRLLPHVKARGLSGLSVYYDYKMEGRHRAMPDVEATAYFLARFIDQLESVGVHTLFQMIDYQREKLNKKELIKKIRRQQKRKKRHLKTSIK